MSSIKWFGHAAFGLKSKAGDFVLVDPWLQNPKAPEKALESLKNEKVVGILITHGHFDHVGNTLEILKQFPDAKVYSIHEISLFLTENGAKQENVVGLNKGGTVKISDDISATMVGANHSSGCGNYGESKLSPGGEAAAFVINVDGDNIYHAGDTSPFVNQQVIDDLYSPSIALLPIGGHYTGGPREAAYSLSKFLTSSKTVIPMHFGTFPLLAGTPDELKKELKEGKFQASTKVHEMKPGDSIEISKLL